MRCAFPMACKFRRVRFVLGRQRKKQWAGKSLLSARWSAAQLKTIRPLHGKDGDHPRGPDIRTYGQECNAFDLQLHLFELGLITRDEALLSTVWFQVEDRLKRSSISSPQQREYQKR